MPSLISASGEEVWQCPGIDFGKGNVPDKSLETDLSSPLCLFMGLGCLILKLHPNPSFTGQLLPFNMFGSCLSKRVNRQNLLSTVVFYSVVHSFLCLSYKCSLKSFVLGFGGRKISSL